MIDSVSSIRISIGGDISTRGCTQTVDVLLHCAHTAREGRGCCMHSMPDRDRTDGIVKRLFPFTGGVMRMGYCNLIQQ